MSALEVGLGGIAVLLLVVAMLLFARRDVAQAMSLVQGQLADLGQRVGEMRLGAAESQARAAEAVTSQIGQTAQALGTHLDAVTRTLDERLKIVAEVHEKLGALGESTRKMEELGRNIGRLEDVLRAPKLRGNLGELLLEELLKQVLPPSHYDLQYAFRSGEKVDAIVKFQAGIVPIDAKFPLESFERLRAGAPDDAEALRALKKKFAASVKNRITEIADKYIRPEEGTLEFALMYIPAENVYYEIIARDEAAGEEGSLAAFAAHKKVIPVSPLTFYAYLHTIALGLRGLRIEKIAAEMQTRIAKIQRSFYAFDELLDSLRKTFELAARKLDEAQEKSRKVRAAMESVTRIEGEEPDEPTQVPLRLERPQ